MSLSGKWNLTIATPLGEQKVEIELVQEGDQISGVSRNELEGEMPLQQPVLKGNHLSWKTTITKPIKTTATMELTFNGDTASGTARAGVFPAAKIIGRRAV